MGAFFSLLCAIQFQMPWYVCLLAGAVGGAIWGVFPGLFKAYFNVNEVITAIMFNWIGMYLVNLLLANTPTMLASAWGASNSDRTAALSSTSPHTTVICVPAAFSAARAAISGDRSTAVTRAAPRFT